MIEFACTMPPSVNKAFRNVPGKGRVKTTQYNTWRKDNLWQLKPILRGHDLPLEGTVRVDYLFPDKSRMDIDNPLKGLNDLLESSGILSNDKQIRQLWVDHGDRQDVLVKVRAL